MSLKDAIREAALERDQQTNTLQMDVTQADTFVSETPEHISDNRESNKAVNTEGHKAVKQQNSKSIEPASNTPTISPPLKNDSLVTAKGITHKGGIKAKVGDGAKSIDDKAKTQDVRQDEPEDELAAMTVRVSRRYRLHWLISAKKQRTTLTAAITEALNARFGEPDDED